MHLCRSSILLPTCSLPSLVTMSHSCGYGRYSPKIFLAADIVHTRFGTLSRPCRGGIRWAFSAHISLTAHMLFFNILLHLLSDCGVVTYETSSTKNCAIVYSNINRTSTTPVHLKHLHHKHVSFVQRGLPSNATWVLNELGFDGIYFPLLFLQRRIAGLHL